MLTVMHRSPDGSERHFEAKSVTRFTAEGERTCPPFGEIRASGIDDDSIPGDTVILDISPPFGAVFVMNRHGTTVAKYVHAPDVGTMGAPNPTPF